MTRDDSQSCLAFSEEHSCMAFQSFIIAEAFIYPYPVTGLFIGTVAFTFHKNCSHGWTRNETDAGGDSKRNRSK